MSLERLTVYYPDFTLATYPRSRSFANHSINRYLWDCEATSMYSKDVITSQYGIQIQDHPTFTYYDEENRYRPAR